MAANTQHESVFQRLRALLKTHEEQLDLHTDTTSNYYLNSQKLDEKQKPIFFGAVQLRKSYVSYHLMPVYLFPDLLDGVSPELTARMQGKSCFNFKAEDEKLFKELATLTKKSLQRYKKERLL